VPWTVTNDAPGPALDLSHPSLGFENGPVDTALDMIIVLRTSQEGETFRFRGSTAGDGVAPTSRPSSCFKHPLSLFLAGTHSQIQIPMYTPSDYCRRAILTVHAHPTHHARRAGFPVPTQQILRHLISAPDIAEVLSGTCHVARCSLRNARAAFRDLSVHSDDVRRGSLPDGAGRV
jgi:hypothetical protein